MSGTTYSYTDLLREDRHEIRLCTLLTGTWNETISCELSVISLSQPHVSYETLSYVWAATPGTEAILIDDKSHKVSKNLFLALRRLRKARRIRRLWIDAICINQDDLVEKKSQVTIMGPIYNFSEQVFIWLGDYSSAPPTPRDTRTVEETTDMPWDGSEDGPNEDETDRGLIAFMFIYAFCPGQHIYELPFYEGNSTTVNVAGRYGRTGMEAFQMLMNLSWWYRTWVVQETILPRNVRIVFGSISAPWEMFSKAAQLLELHYSSCCSSAIMSLPSSHIHAFEQFTISVMELEIARKSIREGRMQAFHDLLWQYSNRGATDPRDKVYAMLGIAKDINPQLGFVPDYTISTQEVYRRAAVLSIVVEGKLTILKGCRYTDSSILSWVPDWSKTIEGRKYNALRTQKRDSAYKASGDLRQDARVQGEDNSLSLDALFVDRVTAAGECLDGSGSYEVIAEHVKAWGVLAGLPKNNDKSYVGGGDWKNAFWRTITRDLLDRQNGMGTTRAGLSEVSAFEEWWSKVLKGQVESGKENTPAWRFQRRVGSAAIYQQYFITQKGYMGLGYLQGGDEIYVLAGGDTPFVLRPVKDSGRFMMVGDCYLHGIMDGEAMERWDEKRKIVIQ